MTATLTNQPIQERILNTINNWKTDQEDIQKLEEQLNIAKNRVIKSAQNVVFMQRMAQIASYETNITQWQEVFTNNFADTHQYEWTESHRLQVATFDFRIIITKKRNLKKFKHVVSVEGDKLYVSENIGHVNPFQDKNYIREKYNKSEELEKKFANLEDARAFVQTWKDRIEGDHTEEFQDQRNLYQDFKDADLIYDPETAREMRSKRRRDQPLTALQQVNIFNKDEISK